MNTTYTVTMQHYKPGNIVIFAEIRHCVLIDGKYYRPVAYSNNSEEIRSVECPDEEIGWEYIPLEMDGWAYHGAVKE